MHSRTRIKRQTLRGDNNELLTFHSVKRIIFGHARLRNRLCYREQRFIPILVINACNRVKVTPMRITNDRLTKDTKLKLNRYPKKFETYPSRYLVETMIA